jgi:CDP-4-dehydro-6-deoxyglucose reductase, E1
MDRNSALNLIDPIVRQFFDSPEDDDRWIIPLATMNFGADEVMEALDSLLSGYVTMGKKVAEFEAMWAEHVGRKHAIMVNSGSSANLAALFALASQTYPGGIRPGDEIITTAIPWSTTIAPIVQIGAVPVFVDVDPITLNIDVKQLEAAITPRTRAIMAVSLLGNPDGIDQMAEIARRNNLLFIEDACEATGSSINGKRIGTFGEVGTFSFFFSHHISTIEGGMIVTDDDLLADIVRAVRAHGWTRDTKTDLKNVTAGSDFHKTWTFIESGFNLRPTEISGAFGITQLSKLNSIVDHRRNTAAIWSESLSQFDRQISLSTEQEGSKHSWFGYPIIVNPRAGFERDELADYLKSKLIDVRPLLAGNILEHPVIDQWPHRIHGEVSTASWIHRNGIMVGMHEGISEKDRNYFIDCMKEFLSSHPAG